jgi:hypothetical protein
MGIFTNYALSLPHLHGSAETTPHHSVLAGNVVEGLIGSARKDEGANLSPHELQGKYAIALRKIGGETGSADRHRPIFQRSAHIAKQQAIEQAANALAALWKIRRAEKV